MGKYLTNRTTLQDSRLALVIGCLFWATLVAGSSLAPNRVTAQDSDTIHEGLYSGPGGGRSSGRSAIFVDPVMHQYATGNLAPPQEGQVSGKTFRGDERRWERVALDDNGAFVRSNLRGGYVYLTYEAKQEGVRILETNGSSELFVNGAPRAGDNYSKGWTILPIKLNKGINEFWCRVGRGRNKSLRLTAPLKPVYLTAVDMTVPDFLSTEIGEKWAAIRVVNATQSKLRDLKIVANVAGVIKTTRTAATVMPLTTRKIPFKLQDTANGPGKQAVQVSLYQGDERLDDIEVSIEVKEPSKGYRRTFISEIDGSVQYYGVRQGTAEAGKKPALFLSVHGAGVKALGQANAYQPKDWGHVIAPTNRREFGFDWEDWGRLDAMEALADAEAKYGTDPRRTYLTGHSMGGHGAWYLGATYPSRWAAIAPMAGWRSFFSYTRQRTLEEPTPINTILNRAANPSRTLEMVRNYLQHGVYIHHGDADRSVPVEEARFMREQLATFHPDIAYYEEPGGGHWYGVDHQPVFDYFKWHELKDIRDLAVLNFRIASPGISATSRYITLYQQQESYAFCGVVAKQTIRSRRQRRSGEDISERTMEIATENLHVFKIDLEHCQHLDRLTLKVDGQVIENLPWPQQSVVWLKKMEGAWTPIDEPPDSQEKNPVRYGGFKDAFRHRMVFVFATGGTPEENRWAYEKARFDAETFYYRGNGSVDVIPDSDFTLQKYKDRSVIVYGNASANTAWNALLADSPVQVTRGQMRIGDRVLSGEHLGIYMVRPRLDSAAASVGVVAGTGPQGARAVVPNRYFVAGTGYPDLMVLAPNVYSEGASGVIAAGYFGNDWSLKEGQINWSP